MIEILHTGSGLSLQDDGRSGWRRYGVPSGGAMDTRSMDQANRLLGNPAGASVLEVTLLGARICVTQDTWLAMAGSASSSRFPPGTAMPFRAGDIIDFDQKSDGLYAYLAVPGGFLADAWFGSVSADPRNGMGRILEKGDCLTACLKEPKVSTERIARRIASEPLDHIPNGSDHFDLYPGPQYNAFSKKGRQQFVEGEWVVSPRSDRTGYRLEGDPLVLPQGIASEPVLPGSFQVPGNGRPIVTMPDGPTVGGYPKIAVLRSEDLDRFAQCAPGTKLSFSWID